MKLQGGCSAVINKKQLIPTTNKDKKVILKCEDGLKPYYEKLGFKAVGEIAVYRE